ncbi:MAG: glycosyltransferase [Acidimicrobiales bacterium]
MSGRFTFAVVGHDEADSLAAVVDQARQAATADDEVVFVDSASTDGSGDVARALGIEVVDAPLGKGRAMAVALARARDRSDHICFLDADLIASETVIPVELRRAVEATGADQVVGHFEEPGRRRAVTPGIYQPLLGALFPDLAGRDVVVPLSGFRALRTDLELRPLPPGYGVETHLNLEVPLNGGRSISCPLGRFEGKLRGYTNIPAIGADVAEALLDTAVAHGRLSPASRPAWDAWVAPVLEHLRLQPSVGADDAAYVDHLLRLAARPLPPTGIEGDPPR